LENTTRGSSKLSKIIFLQMPTIKRQEEEKREKKKGKKKNRRKE
jgi:hypothetical protein